MPTSATGIFDFLAKHEHCAVQRHEIASASFGALRRAVVAIIRKLREFNDVEADDISDQMRVLLFAWLTSPVEFDAEIPEAVRSFGDPSAFEMRWGFRGEYLSALDAAKNLIREENPLREKLRLIIRELRFGGVFFKIFCHRKARPCFDSIFVQPLDLCLDEGCFLHSVRDYNDVDPFRVLIKIGPLRSHGWGAAPDAIMSAPRYETLIQIVWSGCADEPGFGYDPVSPSPVSDLNQTGVPLATYDTLINNVSWRRTVTKSGDDPYAALDYTPAADEFNSLREPARAQGNRRAVLVEIEEGHGILFPLNSLILSFDPTPSARPPFAERRVGETLVPGMFVIIPQIGDVDFGVTLASEGRYSREWKRRLSTEVRINPEGICRILQYRGLKLRCLRSCVENWCKPSSTVIHAPQQKRHFKILIEALSIEPGTDDWWKRAWNEVRISRGIAIQAGVQGHEIVDQQTLSILELLLSEVREKASSMMGFRVAVPTRSDLRGGFVFHRVVSLEDGFMVPESELKVVCDLNTVEQWRIT